MSWVKAILRRRFGNRSWWYSPSIAMREAGREIMRQIEEGLRR